jgi:hypothetical protein
MVGAANYMRNAHVDIVHHRAELIHGLAKLFFSLARTHQHEILDFIIREFSFAKHGVQELGSSTHRYFETNRWFNPCRGRFSVAARTARNAPHLRGFRTLHGMIAAYIFFRQAIAEKRRAAGQAVLSRLLIHRRALGLIKRSFIPIHAQPFQSVDNPRYKLRLIALSVGVLNSQDHGAALAPCEKPIEQSSARAPDVEIAGGRRCKTHPDAWQTA